MKEIEVSEGEFNALMNDWRVREELQRRRACEGFRSAVSKLDKTVARIEVEYNGSGDSGSIEGINFLSKQGAEVKVDDADSKEATEEFVYSQLEAHFGGWEINDGSSGKVIIDLATCKARFEHSWNIMETRKEDAEVSF